MHKPVLYLLAGNGGAADWWADAQPYFQHYQPVPLELPGFGANSEPPCTDLAAYADALLAATTPGNAILAVGVNALLVLHALQRQPRHFTRTVLLAPVGVFLWQRTLPALMAPLPLRKAVHWLLSNRPTWFAAKFSAQTWTPAQYRRMGEGYRRCRAFVPYWDLVRADTALPLLEWITDPIELVWGGRDAVLNQAHAAAWSAVLARAQLTVQIQPTWGHYPWIDDPAGFTAWLESRNTGFVAHSKGGRLRLAELAGLPVPPCISVTQSGDPRLSDLLKIHPQTLWAVRSSSAAEDQADAANAGLSTTYLRQPATEVANCINALHTSGVEEVVVQRFIAPQVSGIAFVRHLAVEVEWVEGHLESLADGRTTPLRATLSRLGAAWSEGDFPGSHGLTYKALWRFLQAVLRCFHYVHGDVEWAWDGQQLWLLQYRPISDYGWRRHLTAANIAEILPPQPSNLVEYAQRRAAASIPAVMARWDTRVLQDNEPFTSLWGDASYINNDLFLARLADWGLSAKRYAGEVGGTAPALPWRPLHMLRSLPLFWRMQKHSRRSLPALEHQLHRFNEELKRLTFSNANGQALADWFVRFYVFVVQGNVCIATALASSGGDALGRPATVYQHDLGQTPHRLPWETDPASPRPAAQPLPLQAFPAWPAHVRLAHRLGLPGMRGHYVQVREWYRDNLMRIFFRLHHAMPLADRPHWFAPHPAARTQQGSFWQDGHSSTEQGAGFVIFPGAVEGVLGDDILLVDTLDPGHYADYKNARAVVVRMGGRLSHGATLLRELRKPSAVLPDVDMRWRGERVRYHDGVLLRIP
ncbi:MAG: PEP-utilizing enzyme [Rhodoferax sp.]|uniref:PEP-utilizing enzyme n=1 Tax=Rhodoferax sp. TaxID=50421 RepID=UPI00326468A6